jgi:hypothetical protein
MMLFPYIKEPATGSRIPSISTGGAAINAMIKQVVAVQSVGIITTPNHPMYKRFSKLVIQEQKRSQIFRLSYLSKVAVIIVPSSNHLL